MTIAVTHAVGRFSVASHTNNEFHATRKPAMQDANSKLSVLTCGRSGFPCVVKLTPASAGKSPLFLQLSFVRMASSERDVRANVIDVVSN